MSKLHDIRKRSDRFISDISVMIAIAIEQSEKFLLDMNKEQLKKNRDSKGDRLIHRDTGSAYLSPQYARQEGKSRPDLYRRGDFQKEMFLSVDETAGAYGEFFIGSEDWKSQILQANYGKAIFGIKDAQKAKAITSKAFKNLYFKNVLKR